MKKTSTILLTLALAAVIPAVSAQTAGEEYYSEPVRMHTFDAQPYNFASWQRANSNIVFKPGGDAGRLNSKCLNVDCSNAAGNPYGTYIYNIPCKPGKKLLVTVWCKVSKDFPARATAELNTEFYGADKKMIANSKTAAVYPANRDESWQRLVVRTEAPAGTATMRIILPVRGAKAGKVWYDDLSIAAMPENFDPAMEVKYTEVIEDATFDKQPLNWPSWQSANAGVVFSKGEPGGRNDSKCLSMDFAKAKKHLSGVYLKVFPCTVGKKYMFSAWFKASEQVKADAFIAADVVFMDGSKKIFKTKPQAVRLNHLNNGEWQRIVLFFDAPEKAEFMRVHFTTRYAVPGKVWIDDVSVKAMP